MGLVQWMLRLTYGVTGLTGLAVALIYLFQEKILYVPKIPGLVDSDPLTPERLGLQSEDISITTRDGVRLHAWLLGLAPWAQQHRRNRPVILFFQENAGDMSFRLPFLRTMMRRLDCPVLAVSYRGYGMSQGRPNERGLQLDAQAGLDYLLSRPDLKDRAVVLFGRSLGGAVSTYLAATRQHQVRALIIENTFMSVEEMVAQVLPPLGIVIGPGKLLNFLVTNKWHNRDQLPKITQLPILMLVSSLDEMVPASQMYALHALNRAPHCELVTIQGAHHLDAYEHSPEEYWGALRNFMLTHVESRAAGGVASE
ncbi:Alpha/Beta hydrolase protein [Haematococcus lacustris]